MTNRIDNTVHAGMDFIIPKGTPIRSMHPRDEGIKYAGRQMRVRVHHTSDGWIDTVGYYNNEPGFVSLPTLSWAGSAGYWQTVKVTPELCEANGIPVPVIPEQSAYETARFTVTPSFDPGHCNRDN